ncbi:MAG: NAD(P)-binding domain-containing protein [Gemmatimonadota bacterium]
MRRETEIAVVGAGPCGLAVGAAARAAGVESVLFDKGCVTESIVGYPPYMIFFSTAEKLEIEDIPFIVAGGKPSRVEALTYYRRIARHFALDVRQYHEVTDVTGAAGDFLLRTRNLRGEEGECRAGAVVVATGGFGQPNRLGVPGEELPKVSHYFREPHPYWNQDVAVVGGGNSAVEAALELFRAGARVTFIHFAGELDRGVKPWVLPDIRNRFEKGEIGVRWHTRVSEIRPGSLLLTDVPPDGTGPSEDRAKGGGSGARSAGSGAEELPNDWLFAMTGWRADPSLLLRIGVEVDPATGVPGHDSETMETRVPGVYIAGVLAAGNDANRIFIENGREHGGRIVRALRGRGAR